MNRMIVAGLFALALAGCQTTSQNAPLPELAAVPVPTPAPVVMRDVQWKVYNAKELRRLAADLEKSGKDTTLIALTPQGYQNLSTNMSELERFIREQKEVIVFLKKTADGRGKLGSNG